MFHTHLNYIYSKIVGYVVLESQIGQICFIEFRPSVFTTSICLGHSINYWVGVLKLIIICHVFLSSVSLIFLFNYFEALLLDSNTIRILCHSDFSYHYKIIFLMISKMFVLKSTLSDIDIAMLTLYS